MHRRPGRRGRHAALRDLERDPAGAPPRMRPPQLAHQRLGLRRQPRRGGPRPPRRFPQPVDPGRGVPGLPRIHRLPRHPVPDRHLAGRRPVQHFQHRPVPLLDQPVPAIVLLLLVPMNSRSSGSRTVTVKHLPTTNCQRVSWALTRQADVHTPVEAARVLAWGGPDDPGDWHPVTRFFRDGHAETWQAADARLGGWGPDEARRLVVATADPGTLRATRPGTWSPTCPGPAARASRAARTRRPAWPRSCGSTASATGSSRAASR